MSAIASIAQSGLQAAQQRLNASAHNVANQQTEGFRRQQVAQQAVPEGGVTAQTARGQQGVALEQEAVEQISASYAYLANLQVLRTNDRMQGALLDERA
ncbi:flagellar basal body protein [Comamonas terrigena]|uniref:flagellar basal body protein n=1 Tax=Comamonas terrigena TaxID=32013 RepID=UPI0024470309|nr:flagellar basal body protein [Comamonas terrigena]MDH1291628.1 flagellar basal body protein [Comamonas terrigena]